jgi:hypothetical protein
MKYNKYTLALVILASSAFATETPGTSASDPKAPVSPPTDPSAELPKDPSADLPKDPSAELPKDPSADLPKDPSAELPKDPSADLPKDPSAELPKDPSAELPKDPSADLPKDPSADLPKDPSAELPKDPSAELPKDPSAELPKDPSAELPKDPSAELPKDPSADLPKDENQGKIEKQKEAEGDNKMPEQTNETADLTAQKADQKQKDDDKKEMENKNKLAEQKQKEDDEKANKTTDDPIAKIKVALDSVKDFSELSPEAIKALGLSDKQVEALKKANVTKDTSDEDINKALKGEAEATTSSGSSSVTDSGTEKGKNAEIPFYKNAWIMVPSGVILLSAIGGGVFMMTRKTEDTDL